MVRRGGPDDGASAVEFALILPLFLLLIFGMIAGGLVFDKKLSISHAAREASRYGATYPVPADPVAKDAYLAQIASVAVASAGGDLDASVPNRSICVAFWDGTTGTARRDLDGTFTDNTCFTDGRPAAESRIQVSLSRDTTWDMYIIPSWHLNIGSTAVARYEVVPAPSPSPTASP